MTLRFASLAVLLISLINVLPFLVFNVGGDIDFHLVLIKCFAGQFWQGDFYPRWCMNANSGLGSPAPLFYFPLPYYAASLLYPLSHFGVSLYGIYVISMFAATFISGMTCYFWLKDIVTPPRALLASLLFLFIPYRMEAMLFRAGYAEIWGMVFLPLVFKYVRRITEGKNALLPLSLVFGLFFLTHLPGAIIAVLASAIYVVLMSRSMWVPKSRYAVSLLWGVALAAFYVFPAVYYKQFMADHPLSAGKYGWPNTYLHLVNLHDQSRVALTIGMSILVLVILFAYMLHHRARIGDAFIRREIGVWSVIFAAAVVLLFPISSPFYAALSPLAQVLFPWRMQNIFMLSFAFLLAVWMQWFVSARRMKTWKADYSLLLAFMALMAYFVIGVVDEEESTPAEQFLAADIVQAPEYRTIWTDEAHYGFAYSFLRHERKIPMHTAEVISGKGTVAVEHWAWDGIALRVQSAHGITLRLAHNYFPIWSAQAHDGEPVALRPEPATGQMLLDIPAGKHRVILRQSIVTANPWGMWIAMIVSILAALGWLVVARNTSLFAFDKARRAC